MAVSRKPVVTARWDPEAQVWVAQSDDIVGLVVEAATLDALASTVASLAPDLIEANADLIDPAIIGEVIDLHILAPYSIGEAAE
jgi:hypothetical protein